VVPLVVYQLHHLLEQAVLLVVGQQVVHLPLEVGVFRRQVLLEVGVPAEGIIIRLELFGNNVFGF